VLVLILSELAVAFRKRRVGRFALKPDGHARRCTLGSARAIEQINAL